MNEQQEYTLFHEVLTAIKSGIPIEDQYAQLRRLLTINVGTVSAEANALANALYAADGSYPALSDEVRRRAAELLRMPR